MDFKNRLTDFVKLSPIGASEQVIVQKSRRFTDILVSVNHLEKRKKLSFSSKEVERGRQRSITLTDMKIQRKEHNEKKKKEKIRKRPVKRIVSTGMRIQRKNHNEKRKRRELKHADEVLLPR